MHRDPTGPLSEPPPPFVLARWHTRDVDLALTARRLRRLECPQQESVLVSAQDDPGEIARAAWQILVATGGLMDRSDIRQRYGLNRSRVHQLTGQRYFPAPVGQIGGRPVWLAVDVERYRAQPPPPGRPRRTPRPPHDDE